jgi:hypothetical protein
MTLMNDSFKLNIEELIPPESFDEAANAARRDLETSEDGGGKRWAKALSALGGAKIAAAVSEKINQQDLLAAFAKGWASLPVFNQYKDKTQFPEGKPEFVKLGSFKQELTFNPELSLSAAGLNSKAISMTIALKAEFDAVEVTILNAHLTEIGGGSCKIVVDFKCGDVKLFTKATPVEFKLMERKKLSPPGIGIT